MTHAHHPLHCILPPYMLENIQRNGTPDQVEKAEATVQATEQLQTMRASFRYATAYPRAATDTPTKSRFVYNAGEKSTLPGILARAEGGTPTNDPAVDEAYDGSGATFDFFWQAYQRNSIDGNGMPLKSTVHYRVGYDNAFWNGAQMVYGDGDEDLPPAQRLFNRFTIALEVIGHELTHGVTQYTSNLTYANQPGALNESFSDVFGSLVKQYQLDQDADQADWLIGGKLLTSNVNGVALRSMKEPGSAYNDPVLGKDPQPGHMQSYVTTTRDSGGVHINSGIPNRAFYLTATALGGYSWEKAGRIWYITLRDRIRASADFQSAADLTYTVAGELYGSGSLEQQAVRNGWAGVGINVESAPPSPSDGGEEESPPAGSADGCLTVLLRLLRY